MNTDLRISRSGGFILKAPVERCFPMFTPEGEKQWAEGWKFDRLWPVTGPENEGQMFRTADARGLEMIWRIQKLDFPKAASYYVVTAGSHITEVHVNLQSHDSGTTKVSVEYVYIPFSNLGTEYVGTVTEEAYRQRMLHWKQRIDAVL